MIESVSYPSSHEFGDLNNGDAFLLAPAGDLHIRTESEATSVKGEYVNAVNLMDGTLHFVESDTNVIPILLDVRVHLRP